MLLVDCEKWPQIIGGPLYLKISGMPDRHETGVALLIFHNRFLTCQSETID